MTGVLRPDAARALLRWHLDMGVDEAVGREPANWSEPAPREPAPRFARRTETPAEIVPITAEAAGIPADEAVKAAEAAAAACRTFADLAAAVASFNGCGLKAGARMTVFADGVPGSDLLVIGEAPGAEEDRLGVPFVGRAGKLLDRMLASIGRSRTTNVLISNTVYWRPPGNRAPTKVEIAICRPFVDRLIELTEPKAMLIAGGVAVQALLDLPSITRARGVWREVETGSGRRFAALPIFHPAFLLRTPGQKRLAWADLQALEKHLRAG
jgi:DNA polymerase